MDFRLKPIACPQFVLLSKFYSYNRRVHYCMNSLSCYMLHAETQLVAALRYRKVTSSIPDDVVGKFFIDIIGRTVNLRLTQYFLWGKGGRCVGLTTLPPSCSDCLEIWEPHPPGTLRVCPSLYKDCFTFCRVNWKYPLSETNGTQNRHIGGTGQSTDVT